MMAEELSAYEIQRAKNIEENNKVLIGLGLLSTAADTCKPRKKRKHKNVQRVHTETIPDNEPIYTGLSEQHFNNEERELKLKEKRVKKLKHKKQNKKKHVQAHNPSYIMQLQQQSLSKDMQIQEKKRQKTEQMVKESILQQCALQESTFQQEQFIVQATTQHLTPTNTYVNNSIRPYSVKGKERQSFCPFCNGLYVRKKDGRFPKHKKNGIPCTPDNTSQNLLQYNTSHPQYNASQYTSQYNTLRNAPLHNNQSIAEELFEILK